MNHILRVEFTLKLPIPFQVFYNIYKGKVFDLLNIQAKKTSGRLNRILRNVDHQRQDERL
jgi:hypothetical protein